MIIKDMNGIRQEAIEYLIGSGFVAALCKKSIYPSQIDEYYEDYLSECWLAILELKDAIWEKLYNTALEKGTDYFYQVRNYVSRVILNTCRSDSSNAYRKLIKHNATEQRKNDCQWKVYSNSIADEKNIYDQIKDNNNE